MMPLTAPPETFDLGGTTTIRRLGFGTIQLPGPGAWGPPRHHDQAIQVLRHAVERGVTLTDTADSYGPFVAEQLIHEALHPYPAELVIATKAGLARGGPDDWRPLGRPEYLRQQCELSLRHLEAHEIIITKVRDAITRTTANRDDGTNDLLMGDVLRRHELQVWFLAEHLVDTPAVRA